ncbi:L-arabinose transport system permease protein AraQ [subsurface metagenome]
MKKTYRRTITLVVCSMWALTILYPLTYAITRSFELGGIGNYLAVFSLGRIHIHYMNSLIVSSSTVICVAMASSLAAYVFAKKQFRFNKALYYFMLVALMIPVAALIMPLFRIVKGMGLLNNPLSLIGPLSALNISISTLLLKNFMDDLPDELLEAAHIDGASEAVIFGRVVIPLSTPALLVVFIHTFQKTWNEFILPFIFLTRKAAMTVAVVPITFEGEYFSYDARIFAACVLIAAPIVLLYIFLARYFEAGITVGALKQ